MTTHYITLKDIHFSYPKSFSLKVSELGIQQNEKIAFIGSSGCGKTTLVSLIAGIILPQQGQIIVDGTLIHSLSHHTRTKYRLENIGFIFQNFELLEYLSVKENVLVPFILKSEKVSIGLLEKLDNLLNKMGIFAKKNCYPAQLSQGEKQRVAIARALIHGPKVIIADEPTGNLDPENSQKIMDLLWEELQITNTTLLMITHDHQLLNKFDRTLIIEDGSVKDIT